MNRGAAAVLVIAGLVTAAFFLGFWGTNAAGLGRHDMGIALALSLAVPIAFYASLICASLALLGGHRQEASAPGFGVDRGPHGLSSARPVPSPGRFPPTPAVMLLAPGDVSLDRPAGREYFGG
jgi:hypothetical protein